MCSLAAVAYKDSMQPDLQLLSVLLLIFDSVLRGGTDTLRSTLPIVLIGNDRNTLLTFNAHYSLAYQIALCLGPAFVALCMNISICHAVLMLVGFYAMAFIFTYFMPGEPTHVALQAMYSLSASAIDPARLTKASVPKEKWKLTFQSCRVMVNPLVLVPFVALTAVQGQRLKGILAAVFAKHLMHNDSSAGWCLAMQVQFKSTYLCSPAVSQGLGGIVGALFATRYNTCCATRWWLLVGILAGLAKAWGWLISVDLYREEIPSTDAMMPYVLAHGLNGFGSTLCANTMLSLLQSRLRIHSAGAEVPNFET